MFIIKRKEFYNTSLFVLIILLFINYCSAWLVNDEKSTECVDLYSQTNFNGARHGFQSGKYLDLSQTSLSTELKGTWNNQTASFKLKQGCTIKTCSDFYLNGECTIFSKDQNTLIPFFHKNISSISCTCNTDCKLSKCNIIQLRKYECGRAYIESGCNTCGGEYIGLKQGNISYIGPYHDQIKSVVINTGCSITVYENQDFELELTMVSGGIHDNWASSIGSYECVCDNTTSGNDDQGLDSDKRYPISLDIPNTVENISSLIEIHGRHIGLLAALRSMKSKRNSKNAYILLLGTTGSGKSATINFLFDNAKIAKVGEFKSTTSKIHEYRIPIPIDEMGIKNSELRVIDTPGLGDTKGLESDAQFLATLDNYLQNHDDLKNSIPNIVLVFARFDENRFVGEGSNFAKTLRGLDYFKNRLFDNRFSNIIIVLTHAMKGGKKTIKNPKSKLDEFRRAVQDYSLFPKPIIITLAENIPEDSELPMVNGYYKLPNGELYPRNLFDKIQQVCKNGNDPIGGSIISTGFSHPEKFNITAIPIDLVGMNYAKVGHYLGLLSAANYKITETDISNLLEKGYEKIPTHLKRSYPDTLPYLQRILNIRNIITMDDVPKTTVGIIQLLKEIRQTPSIISLLENSVNIKIPTLELNLLTGHGYNIIKDTPLPTSPYKINSYEISDIGYKLPNILTCKIENEMINIFQTFESKSLYYETRLRNLNVDDTDGVSSNNIDYDFKPGFNLLKSMTNLTTTGISLSAIREQRLFQLILNDNAQLSSEFINDVNNLIYFNSSDYNNIENWKIFFNKYGTHIIKSAHGGGAIEINLNADKNIVNNSTNIIHELGEILFKLVQFAEDIYIGKKINFNIAQNNGNGGGIKYSLTFRGGDYKFHTSDLFSHGVSGATTLLTLWEQSLIFQPIMLQSSLNLIPISEVVKKIDEQKAIEISIAAKALYNATLKYIPPPPPPPPPIRNETWITEILNTYNIQFKTILDAFQQESKENKKQFEKLHEDFKAENIRRDETTKRIIDAAAKSQKEQINIIREENEKREIENQRRHDERIRIANAQITEIRKENEKKRAENKKEYAKLIEQANQQIKLITEENKRREEADKKAFEQNLKVSKQQEIENERRHDERIKIANAQIAELKKENEKKGAENKEEYAKLIEQANQQIKLITEENKRREEADKKAFEQNLKLSKQEEDERIRIANSQIAEIQKEYERKIAESEKQQNDRIAEANKKAELLIKQNEIRDQKDKEAARVAKELAEAQIRALENKRPTCLKAGTMISMANGTEIPVENIRKGDIVLDKDLKPTFVTSVAHSYKKQERFYGFDEDNQFFTRVHSFVGKNDTIFVVNKDELIQANPLMEHYNVEEMNGNFDILKRINETTVSPVKVTLYEDLQNIYPENTFIYYFQVDSPSGTYIANSYVCRHGIPDFSIWPNTMNVLLTFGNSSVTQQLLKVYTLKFNKTLENLGNEIGKVLITAVQSYYVNVTRGYKIRQVSSNDSVDNIFGNSKMDLNVLFDKISNVYPGLMSSFGISLYVKCSKSLSEVLDNYKKFQMSENELSYLSHFLVNTAITSLQNHTN